MSINLLCVLSLDDGVDLNVIVADKHLVSDILTN